MDGYELRDHLSEQLFRPVGGYFPDFSSSVGSISEEIYSQQAVYLSYTLTLPMEGIDYYISHLNGNKRYLRDRHGEPDWERYETALHRHWWFFLVTTPAVGFMMGSVIYLAITKPF